MDMEMTTRRKKLLILICGAILGLFTSMSKVIVPGPIFNELQTELGFSAGGIALIGAVYMYSYALGQFTLGIFSDRCGGVRLLLLGGILFSIGMLIFPLLTSLPLMCLVRGLTALGAGTVFLGSTKLISDLFSARFGMVFGIVLMVGYLGPAMGLLPVSWLIRHIPWRLTLLIPAGCSMLLTGFIILNSKGTLKPITPGNSFGKFLQLMKNGKMWLLNCSASLIFGSYYTLLLFAGQKCLQDFVGFSATVSSFILTMCALIVAANNVLANFVLTLLGGMRKRLLFFGGICSFSGAALGFCVFQFQSWPHSLLVAAFLLITIPAGFFSIFGLIAKELTTQDCVGLSVSMLNFWCFVVIAFVSHIAGIIMDASQKFAIRTAEGFLYPVEAYRNIFLFFTVLAATSIICTIPLPETGHKKA